MTLSQLYTKNALALDTFLKDRAMPFETLMNWSDRMDSICSAISERFAPFKILLKTKDEPEMLESWIEHHSRIAGFGGLLILDNMSTDSRVETIYEQYESVISIFRYSGFHNLVHHTNDFPALYAALRNSCKHFVFLDTDERLSRYDGAKRFYADSSLIHFLSDRPTTRVFPGTWLQNISGYTDHFSLYDAQLPLTHGLKWGKPILATTSDFHGLINHNTQIEHSLYSPPPITTNFFVLHLSRVSNQQRINANLRKLRSYNAIGNECGLEEFMSLDVQSWKSDQVKMYAREIHELVNSNTLGPGALTGWIHVSDEGNLSCSQEWQHETMIRFISTPENFTSELLSSQL